MKDLVQSGNACSPLMFPYEPAQYWQQIRLIIREEVKSISNQQPPGSVSQTPGLTYKPLFKISELCTLFQVTKPTIYHWIKHGKLKPIKVRSRVYFLWQDVQQLIGHPSGMNG